MRHSQANHRPTTAASSLPTRRVVRLALVWIALGCCGLLGGASTSSVHTGAWDVMRTSEIVRLLTLEARTAEGAGRLPADEPDFAQRTGIKASDPDRLAQAILVKQHDRGFIDAYIRWQLLSFEPTLPELDRRSFTRALRSMPQLLENPRARSEIVQLFERAGAAANITDADQAKLREMFSELERQTAIVEHFNRPAEGLRDWLMEQVGEFGVRPHLCRAERCASIVAAGWPPASIKGDITRSLAEARDDATLRPSDRRELAGVYADMAGRSRSFVSEMALMADGSINVRFSTAQISNSDARRWTDRVLNVDRDD